MFPFALNTRLLSHWAPLPQEPGTVGQSKDHQHLKLFELTSKNISRLFLSIGLAFFSPFPLKAENVPALKYTTHVSLFKSHDFDFHFRACMSWDPVAKSPGPISFFRFSSAISLQRRLKGQLHRTAVVEGVSGTCCVHDTCGLGLGQPLGMAGEECLSEQGRVPPSSLPFSRPASDPSAPLLSTSPSERGEAGTAPQQGPECARTGSSSSSSSSSVLYTDSW